MITKAKGLNRFTVLLLVVFLGIFGCDKSCDHISIASNEESTDLALIQGGESSQDSFIVVKDYKTRKLQNNGFRNIYFPFNRYPFESQSCLLKFQKRVPIKINLLYQSDTFNKKLLSTVNENLAIVNSILKFFHFGYYFELNESSFLSEVDFQYFSGDQIYKGLEESETLDTNIIWHLVIFEKEFFVSGSLAYFTKSNGLNFIVSDDYLINNPIALTHELLHGFNGNVDLELGDKKYPNDEEVVQNIMFNYALPKVPRYSVYQNLRSHDIHSSEYLGINVFPLDKNLDYEQINVIRKEKTGWKIDFRADFPSSSDQCLHLLMNQVMYQYLFSARDHITKYPMIIENEASIFEAAKIIHDSRFHQRFISQLSGEEKFLRLHGANLSEDYSTYRLNKFIDKYTKKLINWVVAFESKLGLTIFDCLPFLHEHYSKYYYDLKNSLLKY